MFGMNLLSPFSDVCYVASNSYVGFELFTAVTMKNAHAGSSLADFSTLKMEAIRSSATSVQSTTSTRRHTPEDGILQATVTSLQYELVKIDGEC
jgi:hypothetical protein